MIKKIFTTLLIAAFFISTEATAKIDVTKKPEPLPDLKFEFPEYSTAELPNGCKVFVIEDHEQPTLAISVLIPSGSSMDGDKAGLADITAAILTKGAGERDALEIAQTLDGVGASVGASASVDYVTVFASSIKKHEDLLLEVLSDVLTKPTFPGDELEKIKKQMIAGIQYEKGQGSSIAAAMARKVAYGYDHPYANKETEKSVNSIERGDVKDFYGKFFLPNHSTIAVIGDVDKNKIIDKLKKAFSGWKAGDVAPISIPEPEPMPLGVYYIKRTGSVQSSINLTAPTTPYKDKDYETLDLAASLMGAVPGGRLYKTVREKHSYTYTPFGYQTSSKFANRFSCGSDVGNNVTDSAIAVILDQLRDVSQNGPGEKELELLKLQQVGNFLMNFESSNFISSLVQNADFYGVPINTLKTFPERYMGISKNKVKTACKNYMRPEDMRIVVVGAPEVKEKLEKFGKVYEYDLDLVSALESKKTFKDVSMTPRELMNKYIDALGGKSAIDAVKSVYSKGMAVLSAQGRQMPPGVVEVSYKAPKKKYQKIDMGMIQQEIWVSGDEVWTSNPQGKRKLEGDEAARQIEEAIMFKDAKLLELGYECEVIGEKDGLITMTATSPAGEESTYYFDANNYLLKKIESTMQTPQGPAPSTQEFEDYVKVGSVMTPRVLITTNPMWSIRLENEYEIDKAMDDSLFAPNN